MGQCRAVIAARAPHVVVVDLTHAIPPQDVSTGAVVLARAVEHLPVSVHLAVVDPGVGTPRAALALATQRGDVLVGPDNGLLIPAARALGGIAAAVALPPPADASATFHGRDVFAPAAAAIAAGARTGDLGHEVRQWVDLVLPAPRLAPGAIDAEVALVDGFGNAQLNVTRGEADRSDMRVGTWLRIEASGASVSAQRVGTFGELAAEQVGVIVDSDGRLAVVVPQGSAASRLGLSPRTRVRLTAMDDGADEGS